jgi:hypothetical protein
MYSTIKQLRPYFHSLREIKNNISLDVKLPKNWVHEDIVKEYKLSFKIQDEGTELKLISILGGATEDGYETVFSCVLKIIRINKELEEKTKLYIEKVKELEEMFKMSSLEKLKRIKFDTDDQDETRLNLAEETNGEGSDGVGEPQDEDDPRTEGIG